ncbi:MAG: CoB--CoM heterodisulfide reductase iron-sulfur subunit B family protein [Desulfobacula sp.]|nr:CoB--CoM heterodisulfide reductase iron-sulfur subunit B family protein [Desulfobacula sp.]
MKLAYFPGCKISFFLKDYGVAVEAVMAALGVTLVKLPFTCCGNPSRGKNLEISVFSAIKNLALAQSHGLNILTPCQCCFGQLKYGAYWYETHKGLRDKINRILTEEGLFYGELSDRQVLDPDRESTRGPVQIKHLLSFLYDDIGLDILKEKISKPLDPVKTALQHGCHGLRPFSVTGFDNPFAPKIFKELVNITGLEAIDWSKETECCGSPVAKDNEALALKMITSKAETACREGAEYICTACPHCQSQYQGKEATHILSKKNLSAVSYPLFLGTALGIPLVEMTTKDSIPPKF